MSKRGNPSRGDTIIEVLLALAVISAVLVGTFVVVRRSFQNTLQAQERLEAVSLLESQLEQTKVLVATGTTPANGTGFCISPTGTVTTEGHANFASHCQQFGSVPGYYKLKIVKDDELYIASAEWVAITGNGIDKASLAYRIYP